MSSRVRAHFQSSVPWREPSKALELLELLNQYRELGLAPTRYGSSEARTFDVQSYADIDLTELWQRVGGGIFKTTKEWNCLYHVFFFKPTKLQGMSSLWIHLDDTYFRDKDRSARFIDLCKQIFSWGRMDHGFVALEDEYESKNVIGEARGVGGANLTFALPGVYWANFFGAVYVKWLGEEKFSAIQGFANEELPDGGWFILAREDLFEHASRSVKRREKQLLKHLGRKAFFEMHRPFKRVKTPQFWDD